MYASFATTIFFSDFFGLINISRRRLAFFVAACYIFK
jgi:hypothetical protein